MNEITKEVLQHLKRTAGKPGAILPDFSITENRLAKMDAEVTYQRTKVIELEDKVEVDKIRITELENKILALEAKT